MSDADYRQDNAMETPLPEPTHILWIPSYNSFTTSIRVLDLTQHLLPVYHGNNLDVDSSKFRDCLKQIVMTLQKKEEQKCEDGIYMLNKGKWNSKLYHLIRTHHAPSNEVNSEDIQQTNLKKCTGDDSSSTTEQDNNDIQWSDENCIATIQRTSQLSLSFRMEFPPHSVHSSHPVDIKRGQIVPRTQIFVKDSIQYTWEMESGIKDFRQTLFKTTAGRNIAVAFFRRVEQLVGIRGKLLIVDEKAGVDHVVALLSTMGTYKGGGG